MITPPTFFSPSRSMGSYEFNIKQDIFNKNKIIIMNINECKRHFEVNSLFIYFLIQKNPNLNKKIKVICDYKKNIYKSLINQNDLAKLNFWPYLMTNDSIKIMNKIIKKTPKIPFFHNTENRGNKKHISPIKSKIFKYKVQSTGVKIVYSSKKSPYQPKKKLILSRSGYLHPKYNDGKLGIGGNVFAVFVKNKKESDYLLKLINSDLYQFFIEINKYCGFHSLDVLYQLPYIHLKNITNSNIYRSFKISKKQQKLIQNNL